MLNDERKRVVIDYVGPQVDCGRFPIKRAVGETITITTHAFADGHDQIQVEFLYKKREQEEWTVRPMVYQINDEWSGSITVVNIDPHHRQSGWLRLPLERLEIDPRAPFLAHDLLTDDRYIWQGEENDVELDPHVMPAHILHVQKRLRRETDFDYFL